MRSLLIMDLDGTLAHTAPDLLSTLNRVIAQENVAPITIEQIGQVVGYGAKAMIKLAFELDDRPVSEETHNAMLSAFLADYADNLANETHLFEGVLEAMDALKSDGFEFAVCTNKMQEMAFPLLEKLNILERFKSVTGGNTFEFRKPDARHLEQTATRAGYTLDQSIMLGDSSTDINAAKNAGIPSIAVTFGYSDQPVEALGAERIISHYRELPEAVHALKS